MGLGLPLTAISIMGAFIDLRTAITFIAIPVVVTNLYQAFEGGRGFEMLRKYWIINSYAVIGTIIGAQILFLVSPRILTTILGVVVVIYVLINATRFRIRISEQTDPWVVPPLGLLSGLLTGTTGSVGIPVALYLQAKDIDKESFLRAIALTFLISATVLLFSLAEKGAFNQDILIVSALSLVPAFVGMVIGQRLRSQLSESRFRQFVYLFLLIAAVNLIRKGVL